MKPKLAFPIPETPEFDPQKIEPVSERYLDIPYGRDSADQVMDLYLPEIRNGPSPLIIYLHEGAFAFGSRRDERARTLFAALKRGYAIASVDYRKSGEVTWPAPIFDIKTAIRCLRANAGRWQLDPERFAVWGMSAGAYYGAMAAVTGEIPAFEDRTMGYAESSSKVQAAVDLCGACAGFHELDAVIRKKGVGRANHDAENSPESLLMGGPLQERRELNRLAAPIHYIGPDTPPFFIMHSLQDTVVPAEQSQLFAKAIAEKAGPDRVKAVFTDREADHGKPDYNTEDIVEQALDFLAGVFRRGTGV